MFLPSVMITIFKTNLQQKKQTREIISILTLRYRWVKINFDLEDCDKILRIEGAVNPFEIIEMVQSNGYVCELLE